ncbi:Mss4-like protein [Xylariaceae sp. FL0804]|nr:Mss4-like protein [Xylariaceae sp. FL0804]
MEATCQCGAVQFNEARGETRKRVLTPEVGGVTATPLAEPLALYICHCKACRRQTGSAFGASAIFPRFSPPRAELLSCYSRPTPSGHDLYCYFCRNCGTRILHTTPGKNVVSVKGGCLEGLDWSRAIHIWTRSAMVPIPEGCESHAGDPPPDPEDSSGGYGGSQEALDQPGMLTGNGDGFKCCDDDACAGCAPPPPKAGS